MTVEIRLDGGSHSTIVRGGQTVPPCLVMIRPGSCGISISIYHLHKGRIVSEYLVFDRLAL